MTARHLIAVTTIVLLGAGFVSGHPHFSKTLSAKTQTHDIELSYFTLPYNEANLSQVNEGFVFITGGATLNIKKGSVTNNGHTFGPGEYLIRARANSLDSWDLIMVSKADAGAQGSDMTKAVKLTTTTHTDTAEGGHLTLDITGGHGENDGKMVVWVWFCLLYTSDAADE